MHFYRYTVGVLATTLTVLGSSATAQVTLNANTWLPPTHLLVADVMMPFCKDVEAATQGRVKCNLLAKAVVGPMPSRTVSPTSRSSCTATRRDASC